MQLTNKPVSTNPPTLSQSFQMLNRFMGSFPAGEIERQGWKLLYMALGNEDADNSSSHERKNMLDFYRELAELAPALAVISKEGQQVTKPS